MVLGSKDDTAVSSEVGIYHNSAGRGGVQTRFLNQMNRLFHASVQLSAHGNPG